MNDISEFIPRRNECPICGSKLATYQVTTLGGGGTKDRQVGCAAEDGTCLLAKKSWTLKQWDEVCDMVDSAGEGYPGAAHDEMGKAWSLMALANKWNDYADMFASVNPGPVGCTFRKCAQELSDEIRNPAHQSSKNSKA